MTFQPYGNILGGVYLVNGMTGNSMPTVDAELTDTLGFRAYCTPIAELRVAEPTRLVGSGFEGTTVDQNFWTATVGSGGTITQGGSQVNLATGSTSGGNTVLHSVRVARYVGGVSNYYRAIIRQDAPVTGNKRRWGAFSATDGCFFELNGATANVVTRKTGTDNIVSNGSFNGELGTTLTGLGANAQRYDIYWTSYAVYFVLAGKLLHTVTATTATWTDTKSLPVRLENFNTSTTTNVTMYARSSMIFRLGKLETAPQWKNISVTTANLLPLKRSSGRLHSVNFNTIPNTTIISVYDSIGTTANPICIFNPPNGATPFTMNFSLDFFTGLTVSTTPAGADTTIVYE